MCSFLALVSVIVIVYGQLTKSPKTDRREDFRQYLYKALSADRCLQKKVPSQNHNAHFVKPFPPVVKVGVEAWGGFKAERKKVPSTSRQRLQFFSSNFDAWGEGFLEDFSVFSGWYLFSQTPDSEICVVSPQVFGCNCRLVYSIES